MNHPSISLVVLARDNLELSRACVDSLRLHTDVPFELIIVDNGSTSEAAAWAAETADRVVLNAENRGFAVGMNQGLALATADLVAFVNNDTVFPPGWASRLDETIHSFPRAGIVAPAVTAAGNPATVRSEPGTGIVVFEPYGHLPSGVVYLMRTDLCRALGGWNEDYHLATGEDLDLLFTVWTNDLDVVLDERVLVEHVSAATRRREPGIEAVRKANLERFLTRWEIGSPPPPRLDTCPPDVFDRNRRHAAAGAMWLRRVTDARRAATEPAADDARLRRLERDLARTQQQLASERARLASLTRRRAVRIALAAAGAVAPAVRRMRPSRPSADLGGAVTDAIRRLRPGEGAATGPFVSIVMLNRDGADHLRRVLHGLAHDTAYRAFELIVVDNASVDESQAILADDWGFPIRVITNDHNANFSEGCNQGAAIASGELILLLNNDISPINRGWLGAMVAALEADPTRGAVGAILVYPERPGYRSNDPNTGADLTVQHAGVHLRWRRSADPGGVVPWGYNVGVGADPTEPRLAETVDVPAATAACLLVRAELLAELGGLDEGYVYGVEDVDLCIRVRRSGRGIAVAGEAALYHHEFGTQSRTAAERKRANGLANLQRFAETWGPGLSRMLDLEALEPVLQPLRNRHHPLTVVMTDPASSPLETTALNELVTALGRGGRRVASHTGALDDLPDDTAVVISASPSMGLHGVSTDVLTVAWVCDRLEAWTTDGWVGGYRVVVPATEDVADALTAAGVPVTEVVAVGDSEGLEGAIERFFGRPRVSILTDEQTIEAGSALAASLVRAGMRACVVSPDDWDRPAAQCVDAVVVPSAHSGYRPKPSHVNVLWLDDTDEPAAPAAPADEYDVIVSGTSIETIAADIVRAVSETPSRRAAAGGTWPPAGSLPT